MSVATRFFRLLCNKARWNPEKKEKWIPAGMTTKKKESKIRTPYIIHFRQYCTF
ncbi:MAG: hypothetical protein ACEY3L_01545 [Wolbachia sp.]